MDKFNCILYGESGVGKTPFCGTLAACDKTSPCLLLDVDEGRMSLSGLKVLPTVVSIEEWSDVTQLYKSLSESDWDGLAVILSKLEGRDIPSQAYKSIVVDSGTELEYKLRASLVHAKDTHEGVPDQEHYLKTQERFRRMYRSFRNLPISFVVTAGVRELKEESTGIIKRFPDFQPSLCHDLVRMTDMIVFMSATAEKGDDNKTVWSHHLITSLSQRYVARDRSQTLQPSMKQDKFYWNDVLKGVLD